MRVTYLKERDYSDNLSLDEETLLKRVLRNRSGKGG
jgi:hypothetical protein